MGTYLTLDSISSYRVAFNLSTYVWNIVYRWKQFEKNTIGAQFVKAIDSISANIAEGFGRYSKKDKIRFYRMAFGSVLESIGWTEKAKLRSLVTQIEYEAIITPLRALPKELNQLIKFTNEKLKE